METPRAGKREMHNVGLTTQRHCRQGLQEPTARNAQLRFHWRRVRLY